MQVGPVNSTSHNNNPVSSSCSRHKLDSQEEGKATSTENAGEPEQGGVTQDSNSRKSPSVVWLGRSNGNSLDTRKGVMVETIVGCRPFLSQLPLETIVSRFNHSVASSGHFREDERYVGGYFALFACVAVVVERDLLPMVVFVLASASRRENKDTILHFFDFVNLLNIKPQ